MDPLYPGRGDSNPYRYVENSPVIYVDPSGLQTNPKPTPNFQPPTNPPQCPPSNIPEGWRVRTMPPTQQYPNGYWKLEKPLPRGHWQPIDPSTMRPGTRPQTHVPLPKCARLIGPLLEIQAGLGMAVLEHGMEINEAGRNMRTRIEIERRSNDGHARQLELNAQGQWQMLHNWGYRPHKPRANE